MASVAVRAALLRLIYEMTNYEVEEEGNERKRSCWVRPWILRREYLGASNTLIREIANEDPKAYMNFMRIDENMFNVLLNKVERKIQKTNTHMRDALPAKLKLEMVLRYLAAGGSLASLEFLYRVPKCSASHFLPEVLDAIYEELMEYIRVPVTQEEWQKIARGFNGKWNFPNCCGAIDGKHVKIICPPNTSSLYYNYHGDFSIVLLALVDDNYCFLVIDVGSYGSQSDGAIFDRSNLKAALESKKLTMPDSNVILGDDAFPLKPYLMTQYPRRNILNYKQKIYNYRHCRAGRIVENAFGILTSRFRIFTQPINLSVDITVKLVKAACALHNWIRKEKIAAGKELTDILPDLEDPETGVVHRGSWRNSPNPDAFVRLKATNSRNSQAAARLKRDKFADYFVSGGAVPWQDRMIHY